MPRSCDSGSGATGVTRSSLGNSGPVLHPFFSRATGWVRTRMPSPHSRGSMGSGPHRLSANPSWSQETLCWCLRLGISPQGTLTRPPSPTPLLHSVPSVTVTQVVLCFSFSEIVNPPIPHHSGCHPRACHCPGSQGLRCRMLGI